MKQLEAAIATKPWSRGGLLAPQIQQKLQDVKAKYQDRHFVFKAHGHPSFAGCPDGLVTTKIPVEKGERDSIRLRSARGDPAGSGGKKAGR